MKYFFGHIGLKKDFICRRQALVPGNRTTSGSFYGETMTRPLSYREKYYANFDKKCVNYWLHY